MSALVRMYSECGHAAYVSLALASLGFLVALLALGVVLVKREIIASMRPPSNAAMLAIVIVANCFGVAIAISGMYGEMRSLQMNGSRREAHACTTLGYRFATPVEAVAVIALLAMPPLRKKPET